MPFAIKIDKDTDIDALTREQVRTAIDERSQVLHNIIEQAGENLDPSKVTEIEVKDGVDLALQIRNRNEELTKLGARQAVFDQVDTAKAQNDARRAAPAGPNPRNWAPQNGGNAPAPDQKTFGQMFVESPLLAAMQNKVGGAMAEINAPLRQFIPRPLNATFLTTAGWAPETLRTGRVVLDEQREIEVTDVLPMIPTNQAAIVYMEETTFTNAAAERNENASYAESALALTERSVTVRSIGTSLPVTDEQLADVEGVAAYLDARLGFMVRQRLDSQILVGDGIAPNLAGTLNVAGINTQAKGADSIIDCAYKGAKLARVTGRAQPNAAFFHPDDWQDVALMKTADGIYIWGNPADGGPKRIWGMAVIETTAMTANTGLVGDYARFAALHVRSGVEVLTGFVNNDFLQGRMTVRAGLRCAVVHYRPSAFTSLTGI